MVGALHKKGLSHTGNHRNAVGGRVGRGRNDPLAISPGDPTDAVFLEAQWKSQSVVMQCSVTGVRYQLMISDSSLARYNSTCQPCAIPINKAESYPSRNGSRCSSGASRQSEYE